MSAFSRLTVFVIAAASLTACSKGADQTADSHTASSASQASSVTPTGKVITVQLVSDAQGNYFDPKTIEASRGDVVRFTLKTGVHNVHFLPDSNPGKGDLPPASEFLQLPGQTFDLTVAFAPGTYYFQCDPHALLGMTGHLTVK